ncbi:regulatory protein ArsR [Isosphaera pallida ATCC 43644]|jgi:DNA-binding transcriptional ArsR family regulator|uniref:Regulatory protein ArsR n=1 Tax=Isosphaera pallida (strain ATCC 43644 / DSM 9630 / IS1B) TaxID=575540 RepID=E8R2Y7_ISOPI|nr:metalloregulator ArsR/SmtB family transcription factor [Isosphaera pallida]ADV61491.1 regulatory protein ArsR [Isosphaera pallida ATCC 43644]
MPPAKAKTPAKPAPKTRATRVTRAEAEAPVRETPRVTPMKIDNIRHAAELLKQVSDPTRLQVLMLLSKQELNVTEICNDLPAQSQPSVSHHLALLRHGRLIEPRRQGKHNFYSLTETGRQLAEVLKSVVA